MPPLKRFQEVMVDRNFGSAGDKVVIEEALFGEEARFLPS